MGMPLLRGAKKNLDPQLAKPPLKYLLHCIQCGIAPAMACNGRMAFWGQSFDHDTEEDVTTLLAFNNVLAQGGLDGD